MTVLGSTRGNGDRYKLKPRAPIIGTLPSLNCSIEKCKALLIYSDLGDGSAIHLKRYFVALPIKQNMLLAKVL